MIDKNQWSVNESHIIRDWIFYQSDGDMDKKSHSAHFEVFHLLQTTLTKIAKDDSNAFLKYAQQLLETNYQSFIVLVS